jgi:trk system potassium uptake protein TrkA
VADTQKFAVIGLGRFGTHLALTLTESDAEVIAIDRNPQPVETIRDAVALAVRLDATNEDALRAQGIDRVDAAIVGIGEHFESAALTVASLKAIGVGRILARAETDTQARILAKIGADTIINPEKESASRWAHRLMLPNLSQYVELGEEHSMVYIHAPAAFCHRTPLQLELRSAFGVNLVAIKRRPVAPKGEPSSPDVLTVPQADTEILPDDVLILVGANQSLSRLPRD